MFRNHFSGIGIALGTQTALFKESLQKSSGTSQPGLVFSTIKPESLCKEVFENFDDLISNRNLKSGCQKPNYCWCPGLLHGPRQANLVLVAYASSEGSGETAHLRSLARTFAALRKLAWTFAARSYKQWVKRNLQTESQIPGPSEWLGMRS